MKRLWITALCVVGAAVAAPQAAYKDSSLPVPQRVQDLLSRMTLEEKTSQMQSLWFGRAKVLDDEGHFMPAKARDVIAHGIGQVGRPSDFMGSARFTRERFRSVENTVEFVNAVQRYLVEDTRLGIPALFHEEAAHGYMAADATIFPSPTALGSTWDPALVEQVFTTAGREARLRGGTLALAPVLDLLRDPRWGRAEEYFGEDPFHVGQMGIAAVRGLQGARPLADDRLFVTLKHFIHGTPQGGINVAPADISERTLREIYLVPFEMVLGATDAAAIMPAYNEVGGVPAHASFELLQTTGRERLGFQGPYFSDYRGITNLMAHHKAAADLDEAALMALRAGIDAELPDAVAYARLPALVREGRVKEATLDKAVARILTLKFEAGLFERPYSDAARARQHTQTAADVALARRAAQQSLVLLKNDGVLPLNPKAATRLAVIGPNAATPLFGGYSGHNPKAVSVLDGLRAATAGSGVRIEHADGVWITPPYDGDPSHAPLKTVPPADNARRIAEAVEVAKRSDVVVLVVGDNPTITREALTITRPSGAVVLPGDRRSLGLYGDQDALVEALLATGKPIVALLLNGRPLATPRLADGANALLEGWYLGQEGGHAVADVLFGRVNPGGKLPVSIPRAAADLPIFYNRHPSADINAAIEGPRQPLFPFGHGLSYTRFTLSAPRLSRPQIAVGDSVEVEVDVTNTGQRAGDEVVQLYVRDDISSVPRPVLELKGFQRVTLAPGKRRSLRFTLTPRELAFWNIDMQRVVEPGTFTVSTGNSSAALQSAKLSVTARP